MLRKRFRPTTLRVSGLRIEELESRITPVLANNALAPLVDPGTGFDGVVLITTTIGGNSFTGTGFLLPGGRHILTAAHNFTNDQSKIGLDEAATVSFDLPTVGRINIDVPVANIVLNPGYTGNPENDLAVMTLPVLAPSGPTGFGAERYPVYRNTDEVGQIVTIVGYGTIGTGTTGQQTNEDLTKRMTRNKYDTLGDRVNYGGTQALLYDFDNGLVANDAFGRILGINDLGLADEGTSGQGDSGGPAFFRVNGQLVVAGTTTSGPDERNPENPAVVNSAVQAGFGSLSHDTRLSFHATWIDGQSVQPAAEALDLRTQVVGRDATADAIAVRVRAGNLEVVVNGEVYQSTPATGVTSLALTGAGADGTPFATTATIQSSVPMSLAITYQRILTVNDQRTSTMTTPPTPAPPTPPAPPTTVQPAPRPELPLDLNTFPNLAVAANLVVVGTEIGAAPKVVVINTATGAKVKEFDAFEPTFIGGVRTALGDVTGDLVDDYVVTAGVSGSARVRVFDGVTGNVVRDFFAFEESFRGGATVAVGDVNDDGVGDIIVGAGVSGGPRVSVFDGATGIRVLDFFAFESTLRTGVTVAAGDVNDDGISDVVVGTGIGGAPRVSVFDGESLEVLSNFYAFDASLRNGVAVAAGDTDGGGSAEIFAGAGAGSGPRVRSFNGLTGVGRLDFDAFPATNIGGVRVAVADVDEDGLSDLVVGSGPGSPLIVRSFFGVSGNAGPVFSGFDAAFNGGVFVGGQG